MTMSASPQSDRSDPGNVLSEIARALAERTLPPVEQWDPPYCGAVLFRIARDGTWFYQDSPIGRPALVRLFSTVLRKDADGLTYLVTPGEKVGVAVDVAPFVAVEAISDGSGRDRQLGFRLNTDEHVLVDADHPLSVTVDPQSQEPTPLVRVRGRLDALIGRAVYYDLIAQALDEAEPGGPVGLWSAGQFWRLDGGA